VHAALLRDLSDIEEQLYGRIDGKRVPTSTRTRRPHAGEIEVYSFPQQWSSTALGFGGIGGQAFTTASTVVVACLDQACVYFGGAFAYRIAGWRRSEAFLKDMGRHEMADQMKAHSRYGTKRDAANG
jgi:hypothetical protein